MSPAGWVAAKRRAWNYAVTGLMNEAPDFLRLQERSGRTADVLQQCYDFGRMIIDSHVNPRRVSTGAE